MKFNEARQIIALHDYHVRMRAEARRCGDKENEAIHQECLNKMAADYDKASRYMIKHNAKK